MRQRWLIYVIIGLIFGIVDWYFLDLLASLSQNQALADNLMEGPEFLRILIVLGLVTANYGIWLVPVIPAAIFEINKSQSFRMAALSAVIVWSAAILSYYTFYTYLLMFVGLPNLDFMLFSKIQSPTYWIDWWPPFRRVILNQFIDWIWIAVIGGAIIGFLSAKGFIFIKKKKLVTGTIHLQQ